MRFPFCFLFLNLSTLPPYLQRWARAAAAAGNCKERTQRNCCNWCVTNHTCKWCVANHVWPAPAWAATDTKLLADVPVRLSYRIPACSFVLMSVFRHNRTIISERSRFLCRSSDILGAVLVNSGYRAIFFKHANNWLWCGQRDHDFKCF